MSRAILGTALFLMLAPGTVAFALPRWIHATHPSLWPQLFLFRVAGALLITAGFCALLDSFVRFAMEGLGTPAPVMPTRTLVVSGLYRHVRNPMYVAVVTLILGQALIWADASVLGYGVLVWMISHIFVTTYEEPTLARTFPSEYANFRSNVPRWIPRLSAWTPDNVPH
jgi:protein-S-isoprenylcysteine O-methyltransferase Ste14